MVNMLFSALLSFMREFQSAAPTELQGQAQEYIYDSVNIAASEVLARFAPLLEARPDLTTDAILQFENMLLNDPEHARQYLGHSGLTPAPYVEPDQPEDTPEGYRQFTIPVELMDEGGAVTEVED
jgi:hypothetical protein